jgi:hypothetical protein
MDKEVTAAVWSFMPGSLNSAARQQLHLLLPYGQDNDYNHKRNCRYSDLFWLFSAAYRYHITGNVYQLLVRIEVLCCEWS